MAMEIFLLFCLTLNYSVPIRPISVFFKLQCQSKAVQEKKSVVSLIIAPSQVKNCSLLQMMNGPKMHLYG